MKRKPKRDKRARRGNRGGRPGFNATQLAPIMPHLKAWAHYLCRNSHDAEDLLQDAICRALASRHLFKRGTNLQAWMFTIVRNLFLIRCRKNGRMVADPDHAIIDSVAVKADAPGRLDLQDALRVMDKMPEGYKDALMDIAMGYKYEEAAKRSRAAVGTIKSRVHRARNMLLEAGA